MCQSLAEHDGFLSRDATPLQFMLLFTTEMIELITRCNTNKNALDIILAHPQMKGAKEWTQTTREETNENEQKIFWRWCKFELVTVTD